MLFFLFLAIFIIIVQEPNIFLRSVEPLYEKIICAFEGSYITFAMRKSMLDLLIRSSFWNIGH